MLGLRKHLWWRIDEVVGLGLVRGDKLGQAIFLPQSVFVEFFELDAGCRFHLLVQLRLDICVVVLSLAFIKDKRLLFAFSVCNKRLSLFPMFCLFELLFLGVIYELVGVKGFVLVMAVAFWLLEIFLAPDFDGFADKAFLLLEFAQTAAFSHLLLLQLGFEGGGFHWVVSYCGPHFGRFLTHHSAVSFRERLQNFALLVSQVFHLQARGEISLPSGWEQKCDRLRICRSKEGLCDF